MSNTTQTPQPIIDLILADINAVIPNFSSLVASYRLLVGASEEIHRTPGICPEVFERAVRRADNTGTLIDIFLELLCCKVAFSSDFLKISCAPVDLFRLLANETPNTDVPFRTAEQVVELEALRRLLECCNPQGTCLPDQKVICPSTATEHPPQETKGTSSDIDEVEAVAIQHLINVFSLRENDPECPEEEPPPAPKEPPPTYNAGKEPVSTGESRVRCKHLKNFHNTKGNSRK